MVLPIFYIYIKSRSYMMWPLEKRGSTSPYKFVGKERLINKGGKPNFQSLDESEMYWNQHIKVSKSPY